MLHNIFTLSDNRKLGYALFGPEDGQPVLYFHGTPSSRLEPLFLSAYNIDIHALVQKNKLRVISIDRPGMGLSTYNPAGTFKSFAQDAIALADHLQISTFKILCWSGGGSYAISVAYHFADRVSGVHIICGFSRSFAEPGVFNKMAGNKYYFLASKYIPSIMRGITNIAGKSKVTKPLPRWLSQIKEVDHQLINDSVAIRHFTKMTLNEACRIDSWGMVHEAKLYYLPKEFNLSDICQPVHYWWGTEDNVVPKIHATSVEENVAKSIMHYKEGEAHISIYVRYAEEIFKTVGDA